MRVKILSDDIRDKLPQQICFRLDDEQRVKILIWMREAQMTKVSTAIRTLVDLGLSKAEKNLSTQFQRRAIQEAVSTVKSAFYERMNALVAELLAEAEQNGRT